MVLHRELVGRLRLSHAVPIFAAIVMFAAVNAAANLKHAEALRGYRETSLEDGGRVSRNIESALHQIYHNLRLISLLPTVRDIDRHGTNLSADARASINQIYNNLASDITVSEVYIVPGDFDPDRLDPVTGKAEAPILEFDDLVAAFPHDVSDASGRIIRDRDPKAADEEIETFEYRQLKDTVKSLQRRYPSIAKEREMSVPLVSGEEVITCDNTEYKNSKRDADRKGIIFSVPFFASNGVFKGTISAIIRTNALRALLPDRDFALVNPAAHYVVGALLGGQQETSAQWVSSARPNPDLLFSSVLPIESHNTSGEWRLWLGHPDTTFLASAQAQTITSFRYIGYLASGLVSILSMALWNLLVTKERRQAELAQWRDLSNAAVEGLAIIRSERIIVFSKSFDEMTGYGGLPPEGLKIADFIADQGAIAHLRSGFDERIETVIRCKDGQHVPVEVLSRAISYNGRPCRVLAVRDLRERHEAAQKISKQIEELRGLASHHEELSKHLQQANSAAATINDRLFRRVGADLHDGPIQLLAYALLHLGANEPVTAETSSLIAKKLDRVRNALQDALREIREISGGLALPELEAVSINACIQKAISDHEQRTGSRVSAKIEVPPLEVPHALKLCAYRFVQEALNNAYRHGKGKDQRVSASMGEHLVISVSDGGPGLHVKDIGSDRLGLSGLRARIEAIGGTLEITSKPYEQTLLTARFSTG